MASNVTVAYLADVTDLRAKAALAKVALADVSAEAKKQAQAFVGLSQEAKGPALAALQSITAEQAKLKQVIAEGTRVVKEHGDAHKGIFGALTQNRSAFMELEHSARATADALAAGANPLRVLSMEAPRAAQALMQLNGVSLTTIARYGAIAAAAMAAGAALVYFNSRAKESEAAGDLSARFAATNTPLPTEKIEEYTQYLRNAGWTTEQLSSITAENVRQITAQFQTLRDASPQLTEALVHAIPDLSNMFGQDPVKTAQDIAGALDNLGGKGQELLNKLHPTAEAMEQFQTALQKSPAQAQAILLDQLQAQLTRYSTSLDASRNTARTWGESIENALGALSGTGPMDDATTTADHQADAYKRAATAARDLAAANAATQARGRAPDLGAIRTQLDAMAEDTTKTHAQILAEQKTYVGHILETERLDYDQRTALQRTYNTLSTAATIAAGDKLIEAARLQAEKAAAAAGPSRAAQVQAEIATYQQLLDAHKVTADQQLQLENQIAELQVQLVRRSASEAKKSQAEEYADFVAGIREKIAAAQGNFTQQIALAKQWMAEAASIYKQDSREYEAALAEKNRLAREQATKQIELARQVAESQAAMDKIGSKSTTGEFKATPALLFDSSGLDAQVAAQVERLHAALTADLAGLENEMRGKIQLGDMLGAQADYTAALEKIANFTSQATALNDKASQAVAGEWQKALAPIGNAFEAQISEMMRGGETLRMALGKIASSILQSWAKMALEMAEKWAASQIAQTFATQAGSAARAAAGGGEQIALLQSIAKSLGVTVATESAKTGATAAGTAARTSVTAAGAAAGAAAERTAASGQIARDAAKAAAGAYSAVAGIPIIGPILAPIAAGVAYAGVTAFESFDKGSWDLPSDQIAMVHAHEMIVPASQAGGVRSLLGDSGAPRFPSLASTMPSRAEAAQNAPSTTNRGGDTFNHSATINATINSGAQAENVHSVLREASKSANRDATDYYANTGARSLPGRKVHR